MKTRSRLSTSYLLAVFLLVAKGSYIPIQSLMAALMYHKPDDHITFLQQCLVQANITDGQLTWDSFVTHSNGTARSRHEFSSSNPLPPIAEPGNSARSAHAEEATYKMPVAPAPRPTLLDNNAPLPPIASKETGELRSKAMTEEGAGEGAKDESGGEEINGRATGAQDEVEEEKLQQLLSIKPIIFILGDTVKQMFGKINVF